MRIIITALILGFLINSAKSQVRYSLEAGINASFPTFDGRRIGGPSRSPITGFTLAASVITEMKQSFRLHNKLGYTLKKFHESFFTGPDNSGVNNYSLSGLQYHLLLEKVLNAKKKLHFLPAAGLYTTAHLSGDADYVRTNLAGTTTGNRKLAFGKNGDFSTWDAGLAASFGVEFKNISFRILSDFGLVNIYSGSSAKWSSVHFTLGYSFR